MKKLVLLLLFVILPYVSQGQIKIADSTYLSYDYNYRHRLGLGFYWLPIYRDILKVAPSYDYRTPFFNKRLSVGLAGMYATTFDRPVNEAYSLGVRVLFHPVIPRFKDQLEVYIGPGYYYGQSTEQISYKSNDYQLLRHYKLAYYIGLRLYISRHGGLQIEFNNNRIPTNTPSSGWVFPSTITLGFTHHL